MRVRRPLSRDDFQLVAVLELEACEAGGSAVEKIDTDNDPGRRENIRQEEGFQNGSR